MANINIGGRLHSTATGNVVTGADEVLYEPTGGTPKKQSDVNQETDAALADRYTKSETYSKTQLNNMITTPNQEYVTLVAESGDTLSDIFDGITGAADTTYRVGNWDGSANSGAGGYDITTYSEYTYDGTNFVHLSTKTQIGEVFDISAYHATGGTLATYTDLTDALTGTNGGVPQSLQKGGMSVKYVQSSDNKYVQYRLMADAWSVDTNDWAIAEEGVYVENPEFIYVKLDVEDKILYGIKSDGEFFFGKGCPKQVKDYIEEKISSLSLDEYEDIVAFLSDYLGSDTTLKVMIDGINASLEDKLDAEGLDPDALGTVQAVENPEYVQVTTDSEDKILEATEKDGTKVFGGDVKLLGNMEVSGVSYKVIENPEYIEVKADSEGKIIEGVTADGKKRVFVDIEYPNGIPSDIKKYVDENTGFPKEIFYAACGDSITNANHGNIYDIEENDPYMPIDGYEQVSTYKRKNYAYYLAKMYGFTWANYGWGGTCLHDCKPKAFIDTIMELSYPFVGSRIENLKAGVNWDYISIFFGWNDCYFGPIYQRDLWLQETYGTQIGYPVEAEQIGAAGFADATQKAACDAATGSVGGVQYNDTNQYFFARFIGTINDNTKTTWMGAWNYALEYLMRKYPTAKIMIVAPYVSEYSAMVRQSVKDIAEKWGATCFDFEELPYWYYKTTPNYTSFAPASGQWTTEGGIECGNTVEGYNQARFSYDTLHPSNLGYVTLSRPFGDKLLNH